MKRVYKRWIKTSSSKQGKVKNPELPVAVQVEDIQWDQSDLGIWHQQETLNFDPNGHVTLEDRCQSLPTVETQEKQLTDDILNEWDSQYDFCVKDSPSNSPLKVKGQRSSKNKVKGAVVKGKEFVLSKVRSCRDIFSRNSMKDTKTRSANGTNEGEGQISGEDKSCSPEKKEDNSSYPNNDKTGNGVSSDVKEKTVVSSEIRENVENNSCPAMVWAGQNGHGKHQHADFMVLQEAFTTYKGVNGKEESHEDFSAETKGDNYHEEPIDTVVMETGEDTEKTELNGHQVEIVIIGEDETNMNKNVNAQETSDDQLALEETIPLGSEAQSYEKTSRLETSTQLEVPVDKRLKWLLGNLDQHSFGSDLSQNTATSNSSDISVDMLLQERTNDPEEILNSLGFGDVEDPDNPIERIPERFIIDKSGADGVSITDVLSDNPELSQFLQVISDQQEGTDNSANIDAMMAGHGNPNYGNMLNSVMHGMKFLNLLSSAKSLSNLSDKPEEHPSILQNPKNREYLAKQGFYERHSKEKANQNLKTNKLVKSQSLDASEKRKRFHATKSRNYSSLTNVPEQDEVFDPQKASNGNYQSFGTSFGTGRTSSFDNYRRSMTSMETSTDSYDSSESPVYGGRHGKQEPYSDSGIWNTEDSQKSIDEEYLAEFVSDSAKERRSQVNRMMSTDSYNVGDDVDILNSLPLSRTGSLENTLTSSSFHKLEAKSSTLKGNDSFDDDVDLYSEGYFLDPHLEERVKTYQHTMDKLDGKTNSKSTENMTNICTIQPECAPQVESVSKWKKFQKHYGVEISVKVPENKMVADVVNNNYETSRNAENNIPLETQIERSTDKPDRLGLGSIGKVESVQSDSSGFAEAEPTSMPVPQLIQKVSSLGSSTESDQTFKSSITILPAKSNTPKMSITSPDGTQSISFDISSSEDVRDRSYVDVAVGTDDFSEYLHTPTVSYHLHERNHEDSGTCSESDKSVILTIELPKNWVNTNPNKKMGKPRVVSHLYKEIGPGTRSLSEDLDSQEHVSQRSAFSKYKHNNNLNYPLTRAVSDGSVPVDIPPRSSTPYRHHQTSPKYQNSESSSKQTLFSNQFSPHSLSPTSLSAFNEYLPSRTYPDSESEYSVSNTSLVSDTLSSLCNNSLEYYKLMKLVNQPMSFKTDSTGQKSVVRFEPKFNIKKWTQLKRQQQLEEETKLVQHTLQKYKAEINMMESHFLVKTQLVKDDLSFGDREDVQELQLLWAEVKKEILLMEQTLANRLSGITMGNDSYNPLLALDIVEKMTELLREQIYQQQITFEQDEEKSTDGSKEVLNKQRGSMSETEHSLTSSLSELKETILLEVRQELHDSTQWLHRELQKKERELNALKMEMMASNIKSGTTRKKHFYESDV